jgi:hypothetical protein
MMKRAYPQTTWYYAPEAFNNTEFLISFGLLVGRNTREHDKVETTPHLLQGLLWTRAWNEQEIVGTR